MGRDVKFLPIQLVGTNITGHFKVYNYWHVTLLHHSTVVWVQKRQNLAEIDREKISELLSCEDNRNRYPTLIKVLHDPEILEYDMKMWTCVPVAAAEENVSSIRVDRAIWAANYAIAAFGNDISRYLHKRR